MINTPAALHPGSGRAVKALSPLTTREERYALLTERHDDVLDDVVASLQVVTHPELTDMVTLLSTVSRTARAGLSEGAQALAGNVLETAMKRHGNAWIRRSVPQVTYPSKAGHHGTLGSVLDDTDDWGDLTLLQFKHYLVLAGMRNAFGSGAPRTPSTATSERTRPRPTPTARSSFCRRSSSPTPYCVR